MPEIWVTFNATASMCKWVNKQYVGASLHKLNALQEIKYTTQWGVKMDRENGGKGSLTRNTIQWFEAWGSVMLGIGLSTEKGYA